MHIPVLLTESIDALAIKPDGVYVDGTLGGGGHASKIAQSLSSSGVLIGLDTDTVAIERVGELFRDFPCRTILLHENFRNINSALSSVSIDHIDGVLLDLGWSSFQIADPNRGLSFMAEGPLDMRLDTVGNELTAGEMINEWGEETLADLFYIYGDEKLSRKIARLIVEHRVKTPFVTTTQLVDFIKLHIAKGRHTKIHPATRVFQALRITVNDEYGAINGFLDTILQSMKSGGRIAIISFHSGEDRIIKHRFKEWADQGLGTILTKKPIVPTDTELSQNIRARSAKLRIFQTL
jgi:16S rRNA (cytosine1402-N4)-methyltransferase